MYEDVTPEAIKARLLEGLTLELDTREGSYTDEVLGTVALQLSKYYQSLDKVLPIVYVDETSGEYIDKRCAYYGIERKPGAKAKVALEISGEAGIVIPAKTVFLSGDGLQYLTDDQMAIPDSGVASVSSTAAQEGERYNLPADSITRQLASFPGITGVRNNMAAQGGADTESDALLVGRLYDRLRRPVASGNIHHYRQWALETEGVGDAKVIPTWAGPGTVKVIIVGMDRHPVDMATVDRCTSHIKEVRPIGAAVTVESATALSIRVAATVVLDSSATLEDVQSRYKAHLEQYLSEVAFQSDVVKVSHALYLLLDTAGVVDYTALTLNAGQENVAIQDGQVPVIGEVVLIT